MTTLALVVRVLHLAASVQLVGVFVFLLGVARPALARAGPPARDVGTNHRARWSAKTQGP